MHTIPVLCRHVQCGVAKADLDRLEVRLVASDLNVKLPTSRALKVV